MRNADPAPDRVQPVPIQLLHHAQTIFTSLNAPESLVIMDLTWIGFYFLLRPGEHCFTHDNSPLCGRNIDFALGPAAFNPFSCPLEVLSHVTSSSITFDNQKNRHKGEVIAHAHSGHPTACPTLALSRRIDHMRMLGFTGDDPLCSFLPPNSHNPHYVNSTMITALLRTAALAHPQLGISPDKLQARSLRAGGTMALLCGRVDTDVIRLVGRWRLDAMFRYLHAQAIPDVAGLASTMLQHGQFTLAPSTLEPSKQA
ncbi:hypothetical protein ACA910_006592 [Epithemia clementina (nom. ined.)]